MLFRSSFMFFLIFLFCRLSSERLFSGGLSCGGCIHTDCLPKFVFPVVFWGIVICGCLLGVVFIGVIIWGLSSGDCLLGGCPLINVFRGLSSGSCLLGLSSNRWSSWGGGRVVFIKLRGFLLGGCQVVFSDLCGCLLEVLYVGVVIWGLSSGDCHLGDVF